MSHTSIPLPVAGGKVSFSDWPKNNPDNEQRVSNKEKVFSRISNKYHPYKNNSDKNQLQNPYSEEEGNIDKDNEYVSSFLSKLPIHKNQSPKKNKSNSVSNSVPFGESFYKGADGKLLYDGPPHVTLDELSSSPEKQPFSSKLKTMSFLPNFNNQDNNLLNSSLNNKNNNGNSNNNKINSLFSNKIQSLNNKTNNNNSMYNPTPLNMNSNSLNSSPNRNNMLSTVTSNGINKNLNSVVIYGYPFFLENDILNHFKSYGEISSYESLKDNNWIIITYRNSYSTKNAMKNKNPFLFRNNIIGIMAHYDYIKLLKTNQSNVLTNSTNSIFQNNSTITTLNTTNSFNNNTNNNINNNSIFSNKINNLNNNNNNNSNNSFLNNNVSMWNKNTIGNTSNNSSPWKGNGLNSSPGRFSNGSDMNIDSDNRTNNNNFSIGTNPLNTPFNVHNSSELLFKKKSLNESPNRNSRLSNGILNHSNSMNSNASFHTSNSNLSPERRLLNNSNNNNSGNIGKPLFKNSFSPDRNNNIASSSSTNPKVSFAMDINKETTQTKPVFNDNNPFIKLLNEENKEKSKEERPSAFNRRTSLFRHPYHSSTSSLNSSSSSITIPKIGNNRISKPNTSSSNVKDNNSGLFGKMVELVFGW